MEAYPLQWPAGWPRTAADQRRYGRFGKKETTKGGWKSTKDVTIAEAINRINKEIEMLDGPGSNWTRIAPDQTIISTNLRLRNSDGRPSSNQSEPDDPGAVAYFELDGQRRYVPCDSYTKVAQNLAGIAATIAALRTLERHGSGLMEGAFTGFTALPNPTTFGEAPWWSILGVDPDDPPDVIKRVYQYERSNHHPDNGGDPAQFDRVQKAWEQYCQSGG